MLIDTHSHLNFSAFNTDWQATAERAFAADVKGIVSIGSNYDTSVRAVGLARQYKTKKLADGKLFAAVGLHPIHVEDEVFNYDRYNKLALDDSVVAIGETGIDLFHNPKSYELQKELFSSFLKMAIEIDKPIIIHNRQAGNEILEVLNQQDKKPRGVMHFFSEDWAYAEKLFTMGFNISFTAAITLNNIGADTIEVIKKAPLESIMIETDAPYVLPNKQKNQKIKRNEPAFVIEVAQRIADVKKIDLETVAYQTTQNATNLFRIK